MPTHQLASGFVVVPVAILLSPLAPVGLARIVEPDPGLAVDGLPLVAGAALAALFTVLACAVPAWAAARTATRPERAGPQAVIGVPLRAVACLELAGCGHRGSGWRWERCRSVSH